MLKASEVISAVELLAQGCMASKTEVLDVVRDVLKRIAKSQLKLPLEADIQVIIDEDSDSIVLKRVYSLVDSSEMNNAVLEISKEDFRKQGSSFKEKEGKVFQELPYFEFTRNTIQVARQVISKYVRRTRKIYEYNRYKDKVGLNTDFTVKFFEDGQYIVEIDNAEAVLPVKETIPREKFHVSDRGSACIFKVEENIFSNQIFLSRTRKEFLLNLLKEEVPEIMDGTVEVKACSRDAGWRSKVAVFSNDKTIGAVGACVGIRGSRVNSITNRLRGEKIDIVKWDADKVNFVINALGVKDVVKVILSEDHKHIEVIVPKDKLSVTIGSGGQNVRLASQLTDCCIDILDEEEDKKRSEKEVETTINKFIDVLNVDDIVSRLLFMGGFLSIQDIAKSNLEKLESIQGFTPELAKEIHDRANRYFLEKDQEILAKLSSEKGVDDNFVQFMQNYLSLEQILILVDKDITSFKLLGELSIDDLLAEDYGFLSKEKLSRDKVGEMIMKARKKQ